jgi:predicted flap endonuclease-1-like 5' DNA nuclease
LERLRLDVERRAWLAAETLETALDWIRIGRPVPATAVSAVRTSDALLSAEAAQNRPTSDALLSAEAAQNRPTSDALLSAEAAQNRPTADALLSAEAAQNRLTVGAGVGPVFGRELSERALRLGLEQAYRALAKMARDDAVRVHWVDLANTVRPRTWV